MSPVETNQNQKVVKINLGLLFQFFAILTIFISPIIAPAIVKAQSSYDLQQKIDAKNKELGDVNQSIKSVQSQLSDLSVKSSASKSEIDKYNDQISKVNLEIQLNDEKKKELDLAKNIKDFELQNYQELRAERVRGLYKQSMSGGFLTSFIKSRDLDAMSTRLKNLQIVFEKDSKYLSEINTQINDINTQKSETDNKIAALSTNTNTLTEQKKKFEADLAAVKTQISQAAKTQTTLKTRAGAIQTSISELSEEQKKILLEEQTRLGGVDLGSISCSKQESDGMIKSGEFYFKGRGNDTVDGHPIGMSQFGIYGAAEAGFDYQKILKSYYTGIQIKGDYSNLRIKVKGHGEMSIEDYISGLGEISSYACETDGNKDKSYVKKKTPGNIWTCFPEEAIKAQAVAARSYAVSYILNNPGYGEVAADTSFQVYSGGEDKRWVSDATKGQVIADSSGKPLAAYYASNFRGWSENNELYWTAGSGVASSKDALKGTPKAYLRGMSDNSWTYRTSSYNLTWCTPSFSYNGLQEILSKDSKTDVGKVNSIEVERGTSPRIWVVIVKGDNGTKYIAGWKFKSMFNNWIAQKYSNIDAKKRPYLGSTEFTLHTK